LVSFKYLYFGNEGIYLFQNLRLLKREIRKNFKQFFDKILKFNKHKLSLFMLHERSKIGINLAAKLISNHLFSKKREKKNYSI